MINKKMHLCFLARSLHTGGAERQLVELVKGLDKREFKISVCLFYKEGVFLRELDGLEGVNIISLNKSDRWDLLKFGLNLTYQLFRIKPDLLYSFLPEPNIIGLLAGRLAMLPKIVWGIRASNMNVNSYDKTYKIVMRIASLLSPFPDAVIANSQAGIEYHKKIGYHNSKVLMIHNGIDTDIFRPDSVKKAGSRGEWGVSKNAIVIGIVARVDPMKDYMTFLKAAVIFYRKYSFVKFVSAGYGSEAYISELSEFADSVGLKDSLIWLGKRTDMPSVYCGLDIMTSSSAFGEGFSNAVGEAMACGVPCVVTDVGDSRLIVGDTGIVVPAGNPQALSDGWETIMNRMTKRPDHFSYSTRKRVVDNFNRDFFIKNTSSTLKQLAASS